ncbi:tyrosine-type recombinase/integrase [Acidithrix ferrooxidans]|uniref:Tyrosine recombinase XerC n=1 Tax=Acidithrix ferrooxidans TaxID=1280514 RepID=A0A0D8HIN4_9ACTN|nr:tyrosine-type recombinase/integrase [Acidithrix ferrooxidans]KJF17642.1 tyrosine recombinase XerC [Acidithrix ferrooxidans]
MKKANNESILIARHINTFLNTYVLSQQTYSQHTAKSYRDAIVLYLGFLEKEKGIRTETLGAPCFSRAMIEEWMQWLLTERGCSPATCNNRLASMRAFLKYIGRQDIALLYLFEDATLIPRMKDMHNPVHGMSKSAMQALLAVPDGSTKSGRRDLALMVTLYGTAMRLDEILSLTMEHLHLDAAKPHVTIVGKGRKIRTLYLLPRAVAHLKQYLKEFHGDMPHPTAYVFYSRNIGPQGKMSQTAVNKQLKKHAGIAHTRCPEVPLDLHAHQLRHAKASHWLEDGMNIVQISFLLGHEQLQTTMVYLDITLEQELQALATIEDEKDRTVSKKWKTGSGGLAAFCGVASLEK